MTMQHTPITTEKTLPPWTTLRQYLFWGLVLNTFTVNAMGLDLILPFIGSLLILAAFHTLRRENRWFFAAWLMTLLLLAIQLALLIANATLFALEETGVIWLTRLDNAAMLMTWLIFILLWLGARDTAAQHGDTATALPMVGLVLYIATSLLIVLQGALSIFFAIAAIIFLGLTVIGYWHLLGDLEDAAYSIRPPVKGRAAYVIVPALLLALGGIIGGLVFAADYPMRWQPAASTDAASQDKLLALGFPEDVLSDLSAQDLALCENATQVYSHIDATETDNSQPLQVTNIAVQLAGEPQQTLVIHHFRWEEAPSFYGTDFAAVYPAYRWNQTAFSWPDTGAISGRLLYDKDGATQSAPYYTLQTTSTAPASDDRFEANSREGIFGTFSFPKGGDRYRGYIIYRTTATKADARLTSTLYFTHQAHNAYPMTTAEAQSLNSSSFAFTKTQSQLDCDIENGVLKPLA